MGLCQLVQRERKGFKGREAKGAFPAQVLPQGDCGQKVQPGAETGLGNLKAIAEARGKVIAMVEDTFACIKARTEARLPVAWAELTIFWFNTRAADQFA